MRHDSISISTLSKKRSQFPVPDKVDTGHGNSSNCFFLIFPWMVGSLSRRKTRIGLDLH